MKKLIVSAAIVCAAAAQAALFNWNGDSRIFGVTPDGVTDNGSYAMGSGSANRMDKMSLTYTLALFDAATDAAVGTATGSMVDDKGKASINDINIAAATQGTEYKYVLTLTGTQTSLSSKAATESGGYKYDYSGAIVTTTMNGNITTATMGYTYLPDIVPASWEVTGITKTATGGGTTDAPEPTSGLLLLVGAGMLALRRKQK